MPGPAATPRIAPLEAPYDAQTEKLLRAWMPPNSPLEPLVLFRALARHPELASRMRPLGAGILGHGLIEPRQREILIHRTCARAGAEYEWGVHAVAFGAPLGLTERQLAATVNGDGDDPAWSPHDALLIRLADELHETSSVSDALWSDLAQCYGPPELLELIAIVGWYHLISYLINAARIAPETWARRFPAAA
ncbi:MAG TPA: hypothetical protein VGL51_05800 [Solirubrobacteraceae bacterium]|jgi:alkylhydroperoxidase family enzyme